MSLAQGIYLAFTLITTFAFGVTAALESFEMEFGPIFGYSFLIIIGLLGAFLPVTS